MASILFYFTFPVLRGNHNLELDQVLLGKYPYNFFGCIWGVAWWAKRYLGNLERKRRGEDGGKRGMRRMENKQKGRYQAGSTKTSG